MFQLQFMIEKGTPDYLTLPMLFYDVSVSNNRFSKTEMRQFGASGTDRLNIFAKKLNPDLDVIFIIYLVHLSTDGFEVV